MSNLIAMTHCPHCESGYKSPCYAEYVDGYKCFSCGVSKSYNTHRMAMMGRVRPTIKPGLKIPKHSLNVSEWPTDILKWLYSYYVFDDVIKKHSIGYIEDTNSILYKVIEDNEIVFVQTRGFPNKRIRGIGAKHLYKIENGHKTVVLVEDHISAIRLGELGVDVLCLFGTSIQETEIKSILDKYNIIKIWLDEDKAGVDGTEKIIKSLKDQIDKNKQRFPLKYIEEWTILSIESEDDPKTYSDKEMEDYLWKG